MHFGEGYFNLFQFYENVFASGKSTIKVQPEILAIFLGELYVDCVYIHSVVNVE
jgi:hypothetical protein